MKQLWNRIKGWSAERVSRRLLYVLTGLAVLVFGLFYAVGFDRPFVENPNFNAPLFTNAVLGYMVLLLVCGVVLTGWALVRSVQRARKGGPVVENNIAVSRLHRYEWLLLGVFAVSAMLLGSAEPIAVNGKPFADAVALRVADFFIYLSVFLLIVAFGAVVFGATRYLRKKKE